MKWLQDAQQQLRDSYADFEKSVAEIDEQMTTDPSAISALLLGRAIPGGAWWQYMKELAYEHPAAVLFVSRQAIGETEIVMPRYRADSTAVRRLGLVPEGAGDDA